MRNLIQHIIIALMLLLSPLAAAEVLILKTGQTITGEIILQNEEVVILRAKNGMRYQYPRSEVQAIQMEKFRNEESASKESKTRKLNWALQVQSGALYLPGMGWGAQVGADFMLGSRAIAGKRMFVGGGVGYRANIIQKHTYSFIPIRAQLLMPLSDKRHAPAIGMSLGYGFAANKNTQGGICAGISFGGNTFINERSSIQYGLYAEWQQAKTDIIELINGEYYINHTGCNFISTGIRLALAF